MRNAKWLEKSLLALALAACVVMPFLLSGCGDDSGSNVDMSVSDASAASHDLAKPDDLSQPNVDLGDED